MTLLSGVKLNMYCAAELGSLAILVDISDRRRLACSGSAKLTLILAIQLV